MLKAVIVDDEIPVLSLLKMELEKTNQVSVINVFTDPIEAYNSIINLKPDVVFLDIEMPEMNGLELATYLADNDDDILIVFVTGYNQYALDAFKVNAIDYILKPVNQEQLTKCIDRIYKIKKRSRIIEKFDHKIICLGDFEVYGSNGLIKWSTKKVEEMLAYFIVHHDTDIDSWVLGETLWPEEEPNKVKTNLHTTLFRLRKIIADENLQIKIHSMKGGRGIYRSDLSMIECDLYQFEKCVMAETINNTNIKYYVKVISLYRNSLFYNKNYEWHHFKKDSLHRRYIKVVKKIIDYYFDLKDYNNVLNYIYLANDKEPLDEEIHRRLLLTHSLMSNKSLIIKCHLEFIKLLNNEVGADPHPETISLYHKLISK